MDLISQFIHPLAPVAADISVTEVQALFAAAPACLAVAVAEAGRPLGVILRETAVAAADRGQGVAGLMQRSPQIIDYTLSPLEAAHAVAEAGGDAFVVCQAGKVVGAGALRGLLGALCRAEGDGLARTVEAAKTLEAAEHPAKLEFLDLIGQELRTHIDGLLAMTELLERQALGANAQSQVGVIRETGETLKSLLTAATDLTRARQGLLDLRSEPVLLRGLMDDIQAAWGDRAGQDGVTLLMSYEGDAELCVLSDKVRLRQVFDALIEPALIQTRAGSVEVSLKAEMVDGSVHLQGRVRDSGPGLPPEILARVFESGLEGHVGGLGVVLARHIVLALNGCIHAESNVGAGVTMLFDFHCQEATAAAAPSEGVSTGAVHILVVDDNATNRMVAEALVEMFDCTSETACDGVEAVEMARSGRFDVILMDIKMPRMDGMAATRAIRALAGAPGAVPIIALTANVDPEDARAYLACGMCAVVEKPIKPDRLLQAINDALASVAAQKQSAAA